MSNIEPPWPLNELDRINKLKGYRVLDTPAELAFDCLTQLGTRHFRVPTALVSLVDEGRQWFKSRCGFDIPHTVRRLSFCAYTILENKVMVVPDTATDERFVGNDLVTGPPYIRFYAGAPLTTPEGLLLGTFCVIDQTPHHDFGEQEQADLERFAQLVMHELEVRAARRTEERLRAEAERARTEAERAEARLRMIVDTAVDAMVVIDGRGVIMSLNPAARRMFGYEEHEAVGESVRLLMPESYRSAHTDHLEHYRRTGERRIIGIGCEVEGLRKDGSVFPVELTVAEWTHHGERYFTGTLRDISARKEAEEALRASEERFRALVEHTPQLMWVNRPEGVLEFFNAAWRSYTGHEAVEGTRWDIMHPDDREHVQEIRKQAIAAGEPYEYEMRLRRADGVYRWHLGRVSPVHQGGRLVAWVGTAMDVHDIRRAQEVAEEADRSKGRFLAAASHDLRQPMQSILLFAEALRPYVNGDVGANRLSKLLEGLDTLKGLLDSLLDISRLDADIVKPQIEEFPISEVIGPLAAAYAPVAAGKNLDWRVGPYSGIVRSDRVLLGRMLRNLVENAIHYTERGRVEIGCTMLDGVLRIAVQDTGIGIPEEHGSRIWEEFHQVNNPERDRRQGLGLGLAIVRRLSKLLNHTVQASSQLGRGSVFSVDVPLAQGAVVLPTPVGAEPSSGPDEAGRLVVVVDDEALVLSSLHTILEEWGHSVVVATSTEQAIDRLQTLGRRPDLLLVDYRLREGRAGTEAVLRVRELFGADIPAIIVTGEIGLEPQRDAAALGLGLLQKPVTPRLLRAALAHQLQPETPT
ncbi:hybrid sensor histidine kinase/response regulator [Azospirillum brasilense]|nr:PAS domain S-box protein [Azospirillum brasilense]